MRRLCDEYAAALTAEGFDRSIGTPYRFGRLNDGTAVSPMMRRAYRSAVVDAELAGGRVPAGAFQLRRRRGAGLVRGAGDRGQLGEPAGARRCGRAGRTCSSPFPNPSAPTRTRLLAWCLTSGVREAELPATRCCPPRRSATRRPAGHQLRRTRGEPGRLLPHRDRRRPDRPAARRRGAGQRAALRHRDQHPVAEPPAGRASPSRPARSATRSPSPRSTPTSSRPGRARRARCWPAATPSACGPGRSRTSPTASTPRSDWSTRSGRSRSSSATRSRARPTSRCT